MKKFISTTVLLTVSFFLVSTTKVNAQGETMTNQEIVSLTKAGLSSSIIINKIRSSKTKFDLSTDDLIKLKQQGVKEEVINSMIEASTPSEKLYSETANPNSNTTNPNSLDGLLNANKSGIYWFREVNGKRELVEVEPTVFKQSKGSGFFTSALTYGIAKGKIKAKFSGANSTVQVDNTQPIFYFFTNDSPKNFSLVKLEVDKDNRKATIGEFSVWKTETGVKDSAISEITYEKIRDGLYKVTPKAALLEGEYAFFYGTDQTKAYDFGVKIKK